MRVMLVACVAACGRFGFQASPPPTGDATTGDATTGDTPAGNGDGPALPHDTASPDTLGTGCGVACDHFDGATLDPAWMLDTSQGTITLDTTRAYRGGSSVHLHTNTISSSITNPRATLLRNATFPTAGTIYIRAWMYFASPVPTAPFDQMLNFANQSGVGISSGARNGFMVANDYTDGGYAQSATTVLPLDQWTCLQMEMASGTTAPTRVFVNGTEVTDIMLTKPNPQPPPDHMYLGIEWVATISSQVAADAWIDEVLIDTAPTSCAE